MPKSHYFADPAGLRAEPRMDELGGRYLLVFYRTPFAVDGIVYVPPGAQPRWTRRGGEGLMISFRGDDEAGSGRWYWKPRRCPTAEALAIVKSGEYL